MEIDVHTGDVVNFTIEAKDNDAGDDVTLSAVNLPSGASTTPMLPASGNPVSSVFNWTTGAGDVGTYTVQYKATDSSGNFVTTNVIISVSSLCDCNSSFTAHAAAVPKYTVAGQAYHTIYKGYGLQSLALMAVHHGGTPPYNYQWSDGSTAYLHVVSPDVTTNYNLTITDAKGCTATCNVTIYVIDVRCTTPGYIFICNNGETMSVPKADVKGWLKMGATLGTCDTTLTATLKDGNNARAAAGINSIAQPADNTFSVYPNPARNTINLRWHAQSAGNAKVVITDLQGRVLISQTLTNAVQNVNISQLVNGVYIARLIAGDKAIATSRFMVNK